MWIGRMLSIVHHLGIIIWNLVSKLTYLRAFLAEKYRKEGTQHWIGSIHLDNSITQMAAGTLWVATWGGSVYAHFSSGKVTTPFW